MNFKGFIYLVLSILFFGGAAFCLYYFFAPNGKLFFELPVLDSHVWDMIVNYAIPFFLVAMGLMTWYFAFMSYTDRETVFDKSMFVIVLALAVVAFPVTIFLVTTGVFARVVGGVGSMILGGLAAAGERASSSEAVVSDDAEKRGTLETFAGNTHFRDNDGNYATVWATDHDTYKDASGNEYKKEK